MDRIELRQFLKEVLNQSGLRKILREKIPSLDKLESLDSLTSLRLTDIETGDVLILSYEGVASQKIYPFVERYLIEERVASQNNMISSETKDLREDHEYRYIKMGFSEISIQVFLKVYNPDVALL